MKNKYNIGDKVIITTCYCVGYIVGIHLYKDVIQYDVELLHTKAVKKEIDEMFINKEGK